VPAAPLPLAPCLQDAPAPSTHPRSRTRAPPRSSIENVSNPPQPLRRQIPVPESLFRRLQRQSVAGPILSALRSLRHNRLIPGNRTQAQFRLYRALIGAPPGSVRSREPGGQSLPPVFFPGPLTFANLPPACLRYLLFAFARCPLEVCSFPALAFPSG
jgi:hypothetical protein